jgi:hypothetical protein
MRGSGSMPVSVPIASAGGKWLRPPATARKLATIAAASWPFFPCCHVPAVRKARQVVAPGGIKHGGRIPRSSVAAVESRDEQALHRPASPASARLDP